VGTPATPWASFARCWLRAGRFILGQLDKQSEIRATNLLALGGSKTAMASAADDLISTAKKAGGVDHRGMRGGLWGAVPGALLGREIGEAFGQTGYGRGHYGWRGLGLEQLPSSDDQRAELRDRTPQGWPWGKL
jgi:hypothetical protein